MTKTEELELALEDIVADVQIGYDTQSNAVTRIKVACQKAGLAFVVKDAEIPRAEMPKYPIASKMKAYRYGAEDQCRLEARAGWRKTEEIETREPR